MNKRISTMESKPEVQPLVYRKNTVLALLGISETTLRRWMDTDGFPRPVQLGPRAVGWIASDCAQWLASRKTVK